MLRRCSAYLSPCLVSAKNDIMKDPLGKVAVSIASVLVALFPRPALTGPLLSHEHITCSTEVYVRVNLEFEECQNNAINNFTNNDSGGDPCPLIKKIVGECADNVKVKLFESEREYQILTRRYLSHVSSMSSLSAPASFSRSVLTHKDGSAVKRSSSTNWHSSIRRSANVICLTEPI